ncbi:MAG TPA: hypothetical protein VFF73_21850, partial [Planctomycetota bacterium]|nr:hypothetical protein [Planctomycetota bacterium]
GRVSIHVHGVGRWVHWHDRDLPGSGDLDALVPLDGRLYAVAEGAIRCFERAGGPGQGARVPLPS